MTQNKRFLKRILKRCNNRFDNETKLIIAKNNRLSFNRHITTEFVVYQYRFSLHYSFNKFVKDSYTNNHRHYTNSDL